MSQAQQVRSYSSLRNTMREFETTLILRPDTNKDGVASFVGRLRAVFENAGGKMQKIDNWGLRTLAYPIDVHKKGIYLYVSYLGGSDTVKELERNLRIWKEEIIRYLTIQVDEDVDPGARPDDVDAESLDAASEIAPDPLEVAAAKAAEEAAARAAEEEAARAAEAEARAIRDAEREAENKSNEEAAAAAAPSDGDDAAKEQE